MYNVVYKIVPDVDKNSIGFSKNYRIFSTGEPLRQAVSFNSSVVFAEDIELGTIGPSDTPINPDNITRKLRYSSDRANWSLWYAFTLTDFSELLALDFEGQDTFFEVKYEYDDGTYQQLSTDIKVNEIKLYLTSNQDLSGLVTPIIQCSDEMCPSLIAEREAFFKPYDVASAISIAKVLSLNTNKIYGVDVIYFKTEPDRTGGDFVFKEWTLFKTISRKCIKVVVPENKFPDNRPKFEEFGVDFEVPFEIHIDHTYFQLMFGKNTQPRKRDFMYFPLLNRMYEIQGSYLYRGFMMEPIYWKIQLTKFHPNIDMLMKPDDRKFLDNMIMSTDQLYGAEAASQKLDALDKQQMKTISTRFDETRQSMNPDVKNKTLDYTFNYAPLIEYYYDFGSIKNVQKKYTLSHVGAGTDLYLSGTDPVELIAYESSDVYQNWENNQLVSGDVNYNPNTLSKVYVKMNGPKLDPVNDQTMGKYVIVEGYRTVKLDQRNRADIEQYPTGTITFLQNDNAIVYKSVASTETTPNMTFCELLKVNRTTPPATNVTPDVILFKGYNDYQQTGMIISGHIVDAAPNNASNTLYSLTVNVKVNATTYSFPVGTLDYSKWYAILIPVSAQYGQLDVNVYEFVPDPANSRNFTKIIAVNPNHAYQKIGQFAFSTGSNWVIPSSNTMVANVRLFNTMVQPEDHEFVISQLFLRDESVIEIIDNARPRLNAPFMAINR